MARKLAVRLFWMMRQEWNYEQVQKFGSHVGQPMIDVATEEMHGSDREILT